MASQQDLVDTHPSGSCGTDINPRPRVELEDEAHRVSSPSADEKCESCDTLRVKAQAAMNALLDTIEPEDDSVPPVLANRNCGTCVMYRATTKEAIDALLE